MSGSQHPDALEARGVTKRFPGGVWALRGVDLAVARGTTTALVGESGCGKTTLLRCFNRLVDPTEGEVVVDGKPVSARDPIALRRGIGYMQQEGGLLPHWTVARNVALVPELLGWERERTEARVRELLELVGLDPESHGDRYPRELSGGQRQRVAFARALASDPDIVLLDEPFGALDALTRAEIQREFLALERRLSKSMLLVTHDLDEAFLLADVVAVMNEGEVLQAGAPEELLDDPADEYVARLLAQRRERAS